MTVLPHPPPPTARRSPRRGAAAVLAAVLAAAIAVSALVTPSAAQDGGTPPDAPVVAEGSALEVARSLLPEHLRSISASSAALAQAESRVVSLEQTIVTNREIRDVANLQLLQLAADREVQRTTIGTQRARRLTEGRAAEELRSELADLAVAAYVGGGRTTDALPLDAASASDSGRQQVMVDAADETLRARLAAAEAEIADASRRVAAARAELGRIVAEVDETTRRRDAAEAVLAEAEPAMPIAQERYRDMFMTATVSGSDMSVVAFDAYRRAADSHASCRLHWTVLAGIGRVESRHGTYGGARPQADGTTSPRIIGIALDGRPGIATITDTDGGAFDGDAVYDRAVGPMQFIPGTWRTSRRDGNGDGRQDPHNLYDAAAAAAGYLCRLGGGLDDGGRLNGAILSYNRSQHYVNEVLRYGRSYAHLG